MSSTGRASFVKFDSQSASGYALIALASEDTGRESSRELSGLASPSRHALCALIFESSIIALRAHSAVESRVRLLGYEDSLSVHDPDES